jgi:hypothetical protein
MPEHERAERFWRTDAPEKEVKLSPIVREILSFPNERGLASIPALLDYLYLRFRYQSPLELLEEAQKVLRTCRRLGYLYVELQNADRRRFITVSEWETLSLSDLVRWDDAEERWKVRQQEPPADDVLIQLTQGAVRDLKLYLEQAGSSHYLN